MKSLSLAFVLILAIGFVSVFGCADSTNTNNLNKVSGVVTEANYFGNDWARVAVKFEDGRLVTFRMLPREINSGTNEILVGRYNEFYFDDFGDLQKVVQEGEGDQ